MYLPQILKKFGFFFAALAIFFGGIGFFLLLLIFIPRIIDLFNNRCSNYSLCISVLVLVAVAIVVCVCFFGMIMWCSGALRKINAEYSAVRAWDSLVMINRGGTGPIGSKSRQDYISASTMVDLEEKDTESVAKTAATTIAASAAAGSGLVDEHAEKRQQHQNRIQQQQIELNEMPSIAASTTTTTNGSTTLDYASTS